MNYLDAPKNVGALEKRLQNLEAGDELAQRRKVSMALVVVGQMLPRSAIKGGSAMALRYGRGTRFTRDLDAARIEPLEDFRSAFEDTLAAGWAGFRGRLVERKAPSPAGVPAGYVMQPFDVKLEYQGRSWCTVKFELRHNEIGDAEDTEFHLSGDLEEMFTQVGLPAPRPVRVMRADHQVAQKLHALSAAGSERARDLVDLQLLDSRETLNLQQVRDTCVRLFSYRQQQPWPPVLTAAEAWASLYEEAADDVNVLRPVERAVSWAREFIERIDSAESG